MKRSLFYCLIILLVGACNYDTIFESSVLDERLESLISTASPTGKLDHFILPASTDFDAIPQDPKNKLTPSKVALGQFLFFETGIGLKANKPEGMETYSCASCHVPFAGFRPGRMQGIADGGIGFGEHGDFREVSPYYEVDELDIQGIRPLTVLNAAFVTNTFWSGQFGGNDVNEGTEALWNEEDNTNVNEMGFEGIESQNFVGLDLHRMFIDKPLAKELGYDVLFDLAFPEVKGEDRYTNFTASLAISAYLRSLVTDQAPFQNWLRGNKEALTESQKKGAILFFSKGNCYSCHVGPSFSAVNFYALGVDDLHQSGGIVTSGDAKKNLGRGGFTKVEEDLYKFKVPQLYNLKNAPFYFHGSSKKTLDEVIDYFNDAQPENPNVPVSRVSKKFKPLYLTDEEKADLKEFLEEGLFDPYTDRFVPPYVKSGNCFPNNDALSQSQLGCN